jgi:hypothetical protein
VSDPAAFLFDAIADEYDRFRPTYPPALVDEACARLAPGAWVLEIGCGTGQLTAALVARGLRVAAVDPGPNMIALALLWHVGGSLELDDDVLGAWRAVVPEAADWGARDDETLWAGARARLGNVSEVWAWLGKRDVAYPQAAELFEDVRITKLPVDIARTIDEEIGQIRTTSAYLRLQAHRREELERRLVAVMAAAGVGRHTSTYATLVTARTV